MQMGMFQRPKAFKERWDFVTELFPELGIEARKGELIGIIGRTGAGKSTLLKARFGLVKVHSGSVVVRGQDLTGLKANKLVSRGLG
ncbi:hypothetical protein CTI14_43435, partial [Methylobacterium radiotolerans]